jgi:hypothetical protein
MLNVITVTYNNCLGLEKTYLSLKDYLSGGSLTWTIIDGASTDSTIGFVNGLLNVSPGNIFFISEADSGLYYAMNKGIDLSNANNYLLFINSGDLFGFSVLDDLMLMKDSDKKILIGSSIRFSNAKRYTKMPKPLSSINSRMICEHQAFVVHSSIAKHQMYDVRYTLSADYDFIIRCMLYVNSTDIHISKKVYCSFEFGGISKKRRYEAIFEDLIIRHRLFDSSPLSNILLSFKHILWEKIKTFFGLIR